MIFKFRLLVVILVLLPGFSRANDSAEDIMHKIASASGLGEWPSVESIEYTFHVELPSRTVERSWKWWPQSDQVQYEDGGETITYTRGPDADPAVDGKFINDLYWLAFPFAVVWDDSVTLKTIDPESFTAGIEAVGGIKVIYPDGVGYTPGDVYEVYYDANNRITHWVYRKGGSEEPSLVATWSDYEKVGPLTLSTEHKAYPDGPFRLWFTDLAVNQ